MKSSAAGSNCSVWYAKVAVLVKGEATKKIKIKQRIRQVACFPFFSSYWVECLVLMTNEAISNNFIKGHGPSDASRIALIQFADDTFFFCEAKKRYMKNLKFL